MIGFILAAAIGLTPAQVLARADTAAGGLAFGTYHSREHQTSADGTVTYDAYQEGNDYRASENDGTLTTASGTDGVVSWVQNANGIVLERAGRSFVTDPYRTALAGVQNATGANDATLAHDAAGNITLTLSPRAGMTMIRTYDPESYELRRLEYKSVEGDAVYTYSDYQRYYGKRFPRRVDFHNDFPEDAWTVTLDSFERVPDRSVDFTPPQNRPVFDLGGRSSLPIPADFTQGAIVVRVTVQGRGLDFMLDSGASTTVIDAGVAMQLGLHVTHQRRFNLMGIVRQGETVVPDLRLGEIRATNFALSAIPFHVNLDNRKIVGLLGGDFFASARILIDFPASTVTMQSEAALAPVGFEALPIDVTNFVPVAKASFEHRPGTFIVDLGDSETLLFAHYFQGFTDAVEDTQAAQGRYLVGVSNERHAFHTYTLKSITVGNATYPDVGVDVLSDAHNDMSAFDGLLGLNIWRNFRMLFDYAHATLYLKSDL